MTSVHCVVRDFSREVGGIPHQFDSTVGQPTSHWTVMAQLEHTFYQVFVSLLVQGSTCPHTLLL